MLNSTILVQILRFYHNQSCVAELLYLVVFQRTYGFRTKREGYERRRTLQVHVQEKRIMIPLSL